MPFMLPTILSNLFGGPATRLYPVTSRELFANARGHIIFDDNTCVYCGNCARKCPAVAIEVNVKKKELNFYPSRCIVCEVCIEACPRNSISLNSKWRTPFYEIPVEEHRGRVEDKEKKAQAKTESVEKPVAKSENQEESKSEENQKNQEKQKEEPEMNAPQ